MKISNFNLYEARYTDRNYFLRFFFNNNQINLTSSSIQGIFKEGVNFLFQNGYNFDEQYKSRRLLDLSDIPKSYKPESSSQNVYKIPNTNKYILCNFGPHQLINNLLIMFQRFGINTSQIETNIEKNLESQENSENMTFINAAQDVLRNNYNKPMTSNEIWEEISKSKLVKTQGTTPAATLNAQLLMYSDNSDTKRKYKNKLFTIVGKNPMKFELINYNTANVYCVRAGQGNKDVELFINNKFVGIGYSLDNFDISKKSTQEITDQLKKIYPNDRSVQQYISQIDLFKKIQIGDYVLVPDDEKINVGKITSDTYLSTSPYPNRKNVEWVVRISKDGFTNLPKTVYIVTNFDINEMSFTSEKIESDIIPFNKFGLPHGYKAIQAQDETESVEVSKNPFGGGLLDDSLTNSALCILGESGKGKSTTVEDYLRENKHTFDYIIPTATTTALLSQYTPKGGGDYIQSRLGRLINQAVDNPSKLYTAVIDECHKSNTIEMINDELLQCISKKRNRGNRFISVDDDTANLYKGLKKFEPGENLLIPDNFGFIFLSSKPDVIISNTDFFNRVNIVVMVKRPKSGEVVDSLTDPKYFKIIEGKNRSAIEEIKSLFPEDE